MRLDWSLRNEPDVILLRSSFTAGSEDVTAGVVVVEVVDEAVRVNVVVVVVVELIDEVDGC